LAAAAGRRPCCVPREEKPGATIAHHHLVRVFLLLTAGPYIGSFATEWPSTSYVGSSPQ
jgi:hypothetical protein